MVVPSDFLSRNFNFDTAEKSQALQMRLCFAHALVGTKEDGSPTRSLDLETLEQTIKEMRELVVTMGVSRIEALFVKKFAEDFPTFRFKGSRKVSCFLDLAEAYRAGPNDNRMRMVIHHAMIGMWGSSNQWAVNMEIEIADALNIEFSGQKASGERSTRSHQGNCIKGILVKKKGALLEPIRTAGKTSWNEGIFQRNMEKEYCFRADVTSVGFDGWLALYQGHPWLQDKKLVRKGNPYPQAEDDYLGRSMPVLPPLSDSMASMPRNALGAIQHPVLKFVKSLLDERRVTDVNSLTSFLMAHTGMGSARTGQEEGNDQLESDNSSFSYVKGLFQSGEVTDTDNLCLKLMAETGRAVDPVVENSLKSTFHTGHDSTMHERTVRTYLLK